MMDKFIKLTNNDSEGIYILKDIITQICEYVPDKMILTFNSGYIKNTMDEKCNSYIIIKSPHLAFNGEVIDTTRINVIETIEEIANKMKE